jgi:amidase
MTQLWQLPALEIARRVAARDLPCVVAVNPGLNAVVRVLDDDARAAARAADAKMARGEPLGSLQRGPIIAKEKIHLVDRPTTWGVAALARGLVPVDTPVVERMRRAGAIVVGRTNLPDMALRTLSGAHPRDPRSIGVPFAGSMLPAPI